MKVVILAGGRGTRLAEETSIRPKPMVEIGGKPILWHIMRHYESYGLEEFVLALGYLGDYVKKWMVDYAALAADITIDFRTGDVKSQKGSLPTWNVELVDTGLETMTGGRVGRVAGLIRNETFMLTYGDGVSDVDLHELLRFHRSHGRLVTLTAVRPPARFGHLEFRGDEIVEFSEKPQTGEGWINGGFCVAEPGVLDFISGDASVWESDVLRALSLEGELMAFRHDGFWQCMDTLRDKQMLEELWASDRAPWNAALRLMGPPQPLPKVYA